MSTIKIIDLAVSGLSPHTKYKFEFENKGGNWPIRVSPLSGVFFPERVKTYVYFCSNSGECPDSDVNVFYNMPSNNPASPGLSLEAKSLYSVLDLVIKDFDTSEVVYTHPCIVECDECAPNLEIMAEDINLSTDSNNSSHYDITFNNLIANQTYTYVLNGDGGNWPIKISPISGTINTQSSSYIAKGILSFCPYSGACLSNDENVLNYSDDFDSRQYNQDPYSVIKVTISPSDEYLQKTTSQNFIVTCDNCIPQLSIEPQDSILYIDDITIGQNLNVVFKNLVVGQKYNYTFNGKNGNWPLIVSSPSGSIRATSTSMSMPFLLNFCSNTGVCPDGLDGVMTYDADQLKPVILNNIHKQSQFNISLYQQGYDEPTVTSNDILVQCNNCIQDPRVSLPVSVIIEDTNTSNIQATLNNLIIGEKYNYVFTGLDNNWPVLVSPASGTIIAADSRETVDAKLVYCESSGSCPNGAKNVLVYTYTNNSILSPNANVKITITPENTVLPAFSSNVSYIDCINCLRPKSFVQLPNSIVLDSPTADAQDIELQFNNLVPGESYDYYYRGLGNNWPAAIYPISGTVVATEESVSLVTKMQICASTGLCPDSNEAVLSYENSSVSNLNKNINFIVDVVPKNNLLDSFSSNMCSVYCKNCVVTPSIVLADDATLTDDDTYTINASISNLSPEYSYKYKFIGVNANWPVVIYPISGTIEGVSEKSISSKLAFCSSTGICSDNHNLLPYDIANVCDRNFSPLNKFAQIRLELITSETDPSLYSNEVVIGCDNCIKSLNVSLGQDYVNLQNTNMITVTGTIDNIIPNKSYLYEIEGMDGNWPAVVYPISGLVHTTGTTFNVPVKLSFCPSTGVCPEDAGLPVLPYAIDNNCYTGFGGINKYSSMRLKVSELDCDSETIYSNTVKLSCVNCLPEPVIMYKDDTNLSSSLEKYITNNDPYELQTMFSGLIIGQIYEYTVNYVDSTWPCVVTPQSGSFIAKNSTKTIKTNIGFCYPTGLCVNNDTDAILTYSSNSLYDNSDKKFVSINFSLDSGADCLVSTTYSDDFTLICSGCLPVSTYNVSISGAPVMTLPNSCCSGTRLVLASVSGAIPKVQHSYYFEALSPNISIQAPSSGYVTFKDNQSYNVFAITNVNLSEYDEGLVRFRLVNELDSVETIDYLAIKCGNGECPT